MGLDAAPLSTLRDLDAGTWRGAELGLVAPEEVGRWLAEPGYREHGGESVLDVIERARGWLGEMVAEDRPHTVAVTHPAVIRAVLVVALDTAPESFWRFDVAPGARVRLHHRSAWTLRLN